MNLTRIIGIDPGLNHTGWGIIESMGNRVHWVAHGIISPHSKMPLSDRLGVLARDLSQILCEFKPNEAAIEETFVANSAKSSLLLGHARGAAMAVLATKDLLVAEYATRLVKKAIVGTGAAEKEQMAFMVKRLLPNMDTKNNAYAKGTKLDAYDALAVALCHANLRKSHAIIKGAMQ